ncbi:hypothetical protein [Rhodobacteraceae bacterium DSL-40]|uniref:hypothetical protein n=1 Tax=Amaricoccus sp. B4 TaxID=3368557 RepID=UPI000DAE5645
MSERAKLLREGRRLIAMAEAKEKKAAEDEAKRRDERIGALILERNHLDPCNPRHAAFVRAVREFTGGRGWPFPDVETRDVVVKLIGSNTFVQELGRLGVEEGKP